MGFFKKLTFKNLTKNISKNISKIRTKKLKNTSETEANDTDDNESVTSQESDIQSSKSEVENIAESKSITSQCGELNDQICLVEKVESGKINFLNLNIVERNLSKNI